MKMNLAARIGGWSAKHRKTAIIGWLLIVVVTSVVGGMAGQSNMKPYENMAGDSARAERILADAGIKEPAGEMVLIKAATPGGWRSAADALTTAVRNTGETPAVKRPVVAGNDALIRFDMKGDAETAPDRVQPVLDAVAKVKAAHPEVRIHQFGGASSGKWLNDLLGKDFAQAEWTAVPLALGILLVAFGALMAAVLPLLLALTAFMASVGLLAIASHGLHVADTTSSVMLLMGLAVGVDYCLFYLRRERDERKAGRDKETALRIAAATSGRSVLISGLTVMLAMAGMFLSGLMLFQGFALATILVVFVAMAGSVTVLPALLSLLGDKVELGRIPFLKRRRRTRGKGRILGTVLNHPGVFATLATALLLALAAPALGMRTEQLGLEKQAGHNQPLAVAYQEINKAFPGGPAPARVVVKPADPAAIARFKAAVGTRVTMTTRGDVAEIEVPMDGPAALDRLRDKIVPSTLGPAGHVSGDLASSRDFTDQLKKDILPIFLFVMVVTFVLMLISFRSVVIALTAIVLNLLSVAAAYGVMVAVFQHGWGAGLIGSEKAGAIESWLPLFVFVVLFGLSMDYHVFVVSRIREARDRGMTTTNAVAHGLRSTAGVVTGAAVIMIAVFAVFGTLSMQDMQQMGIGLAVAVLLDATVVRAVLLPSVMSLLGEKNWYLPRFLHRLPTISHGEPPEPAYAPAHASVGNG